AEQCSILTNLRAARERHAQGWRYSLARDEPGLAQLGSRISGCLRSQSGRRPVTAGVAGKFSGGGGEDVAHSRVNASHGSSPATSPERRLRTRFAKKITIATARIAAPMVETRFNGPQPVLAAQAKTRRGIPTAPSPCCGRQARV